jgi:hypothetical protein
MRRLGMVRLNGPDDGIRRYRLARLDEIAIASPPEEATPRPSEAPEPAGPEPGEGEDVDRRSDRAA